MIIETCSLQHKQYFELVIETFIKHSNDLSNLNIKKKHFIWQLIIHIALDDLVIIIGGRNMTQYTRFLCRVSDYGSDM